MYTTFRSRFSKSFDMEGVSTFLASSSIHGLTYIATTQKHIKLFWTLVVVTGFMVAGVLIKESLDSWLESPVKTTTETLPISDIKLPKVTVCPPKNTFTDLNFDLMMTENITLTEEMRNEMFKHALDVLNRDGFSKNIWEKIQEEDRGYNWYHGITQIKSPCASSMHQTDLFFDIDTSDVTGVLATQFYGEKFQSELVDRKSVYYFCVYTPASVRDNENVTLHIKVEKVSMKGLSWHSKDDIYVDEFRWIFKDQTKYTNFTNPLPIQYCGNYKRDVTSEEVDKQKLDVMPGFKLSWWYTGVKVTPHPRHKDDDITKQLIR